MRQLTLRWPPVVLAGLMCIYALALPGSAAAYFDLGTVSVTTGSSSVAVTAGSTATVSVTVSPASMAELPGCGMATCPDDCGPGCLDSNGQCTCGGTTYTTYTTAVTASSSDAAVAEVSYSAGMITVTGVGPGTATITITASLRQYSNGYATVQVTCSPRASSPSPRPTPHSSTTPSSRGRANGSVSGSGGSHASRSAADKSGTGVTTDHGRRVLVIRLVGTMAPAEALDRAAAKGLLVTFWTGLSAARPAYSWTFDGRQLPRREGSIDLGIDTATAVGGELGRMIVGRHCLVLGFNYSGALPAPALVRLAVGSTYPDGKTVTLYSYDASHHAFLRQARDLKVKAGFVGLPLRHCSIYVLSTVGDLCCLPAATPLGSGSTGGHHSLMAALVAALVVAAAIVVIALLLLKRRVRRSAAEADRGSGAGVWERR